ncbi:Lar family restriction alleviation protein [Xenorhabdus bharatensis]|uniref:Lar family restriction alleviation protein n=1 Tax=Xenorhabdus bharatensis TaxID=3136256 RepID=UPI0030F46F78
MSIEIKPCPFCGGENLGVDHEHDKRNGLYDSWVICFECDSKGPISYYNKSKDDAVDNAINLWNKREG